ncbi:hypothetical protein D8674_029492 [Pyrus ussuriensis x Pyrus communis]|uniref:DUF2828 domain-containing protein n=1 Tax=Pyrus ussuriensis x Pyrus communis TaxID=2448454 RepID=A0A5N5HZ72_9ROSA|nr:hypothetical protein D8674_029492 [Pyrus ussuriensis x Pyrus communis]
MANMLSVRSVMAPYATFVRPPELKLSRHPFVDPDFKKATVMSLMTRINMMKPLNLIPVMGLITRNQLDSMQVLVATSEPSSVDGSFSNGNPFLDLFLHKDTAEACAPSKPPQNPSEVQHGVYCPVVREFLSNFQSSDCSSSFERGTPVDYRGSSLIIMGKQDDIEDQDVEGQDLKQKLQALKQSNINDLDHDEYYWTEITDAAVSCLSMGTNSSDRTLLLESIAKKVFPRESCPEYRGVLKEANYTHSIVDRLRKEVLLPLDKACRSQGWPVEKYLAGVKADKSNIEADGLFPDQVSTYKEHYQRFVGRLIYLSHTRLDIAYAVSVVSQFMHSPSEAYIDVVIRILRVYNADWAGSITDRRSTSGYFTFVCVNLVTWRSKKPKGVARSCAEAEFCGMSHGVYQLADVLTKAVSNSVFFNSLDKLGMRDIFAPT